MRSALTIFGIAIGIFAFTTMGALATSINRSIDTGLDYYSSRIILTSETAGFGGLFAIGPLVPASLAERTEAIEGVDRAYPTIILSADEDEIPTFSSPSLLVGSPPDEAASDPSPLEVNKGRKLTGQDRGKIVLGSAVATKTKAEVGQTVTVLGKQFEVVGILRFLNSDPDGYYVTNIEDAREVMTQKAQFTTDPGLVSSINVIPKAGTDTTALAKQLEERLPGTVATPPEQLRKQIEDASQVLNLVVLGSALIALLVGSLSVINTMLVSVGERRKEFGLKRVVGARTRHIIVEVMTETAMIGLIGGLFGLALGAALVTYINAIASGSGSFEFTLTPGLAASSVGFAMLLGVIAGLYPAWRATRIKPVNVLREQ